MRIDGDKIRKTSLETEMFYFINDNYNFNINLMRNNNFSVH